MKESKFSEAQIAFVLKQAEDGTPIGEVCRKAGISDATFCSWRKKYAGLNIPSGVTCKTFHLWSDCLRYLRGNKLSKAFFAAYRRRIT